MIAMNCMVCGMPTYITVKRRDIEAAFCPAHVPKSKILISISVRY
jgi:hypothetical protein